MSEAHNGITESKLKLAIEGQKSAGKVAAVTGGSGLLALFAVNWLRAQGPAWLWPASQDIEAIILLTAFFTYLSRAYGHLRRRIQRKPLLPFGIF